MTIPVVVLAVGSLLVGWLGIPDAVGGSQIFGKLVSPSFQGSMTEADAVPGHLEPLFMVLSFLVALLGIGLAWMAYYRKGVSVVEEAERRIPHLRKILENKFWVDEIYDATVLALDRFLSRYVSEWFLERQVFGRSVTVVAETVRSLGQGVSALATGVLSLTLVGMALGASLLLYLWLR